MFARAVFAFLVLPGMVAIFVPAGWVWLWSDAKLVHSLALALLALGFAALLWCVRDFYLSGKGTLAPWAPPIRLVVVGLYRYSRNPMYVAVALMLLGWAFSFGSRSLLIYAIVVVVAFHLRVVLWEVSAIA
jgi:protein-S-isoprenylcysteine O-methyltransferase Ste14